MEKLTDCELNKISVGGPEKGVKSDSNAKTAEALSILGAGKPHGSALGYKGRPAHDTTAYEDSN